MFIIALFSFIPLTTALHRDPTKMLKSLPTFSNSLVNLGKMDLSFYFMAKPEDFKKFENVDHSVLHPPENEHLIVEPCPCSSKYSRKFPKNNPSELLKMILRNNDLFKEPESSAMCCESHENFHEETVLIELNPYQNQIRSPIQHNQLPFLPLLFKNALPNKPTLPVKTKAVEIFFFPNKKEMSADFGKAQKKEFRKENIQIVGDKELKNDFKTMKPPMKPFHGVQSSVKKDLALEVKENAVTTKVDEIKLDATAAVANML